MLVYLRQILRGFVGGEPVCYRGLDSLSLFLSQIIGYLAGRTSLEVF
jgi:hypothetical protein